MKLAENQVGRSSTEKVDFTEVTSCLTVLVELEDGSTAGAHLALQTPKDGMNAAQVLPELRRQIGDTKIKSVTIGGYGDLWAAEYLIMPPITSDDDHNWEAGETDQFRKGFAAVGPAILDELGFKDKSKVTYKRA